MRRHREVIIHSHRDECGLQHGARQSDDRRLFLHVKRDHTGQGRDNFYEVNACLLFLFFRGGSLFLGVQSAHHLAKVNVQLKGSDAEQRLKVQSQHALTVIDAELFVVSIAIHGIHGKIDLQAVQSFQAFRHVHGGAHRHLIITFQAFVRGAIFQNVEDGINAQGIKKGFEGPSVAIRIGHVFTQAVRKVYLKLHLCLHGVQGCVIIKVAEEICVRSQKVCPFAFHSHIEIANTDLPVKGGDQRGHDLKAQTFVYFIHGSGKFTESKRGIDLGQGDLHTRKQQDPRKDLGGKIHFQLVVGYLHTIHKL